MSAFVLVAWLLQAALTRVDIVSVTGCLREAIAGNWIPVNATGPVPSNANAPGMNDIPATPPVGKNQFKLIGVSEFNLPQHKDHTVIVKSLNLQATPVGRLNITSVTTIAPSCAVPK